MFIYIIFLKISLLASLCIEDNNHCAKCNPVSKLCVKCDNDILVPDQNGGCEYSKKCILGKNNCLECNINDDLCLKCTDGYFPDEIGGCSYTDNCEISYQGKCLKCKNDFILIGEDKEYNKENEIKICKSLYSGDLKNCEIINTSSGQCEKCKEGFFLNNGDKNCVSTENCYESIFEICTKCNPNYYLDKKNLECKNQTDNFEHCKQSIDGETCDSCDEGYFFDDEHKCIDVKFCSKGKNGFICEKCMDGYYLNNYQNFYFCTNTENCLFGDREIGICKKCIKGYYIDYKDGKCKSNEENNDLKYCQIADGECIQCLSDYELGSDNKCSSTKYCAESIDGECIQCIDNYYLGLDKKCTNVEHCIYSNGYCRECEKNFYYDFSEKKCQKAEGIFENCKNGYSVSNCEDCKDDFYYNQTDHLCYSNQEVDNIFYKCKRVSSYGECTYCVNGYDLGELDNKCSKIKGCALSENENKCLECDYFYYCLDKKTGKCEINDEIIDEDKKFYFRCNKTNDEGTRCAECNYGFILNDKGLCIDDQNCLEKNESGECTKCNFEKGDYCLNEIFGCVKILGYSYCLECNNIFDFYNCTKCSEGYTLNLYGGCSKNS